ncbi:MAG: TonB-dependent receptor [Candidatus Marinimicrobia bacterium]|nr:TonB-dependent receptor [Candidatus Neomarinimicrobiota bacterium]
MKFTTLKDILLTFTLILLLTSTTLAQRPGNNRQMPSIGVLTGRVLDAISLEPVEYANITIIRTRDTSAVSGGISNADGYFDLRELPLGRFMVRFEFMGYETLIIDEIRLTPRESVEKHLGDILLKSTTLIGGRVEVTGDRPLITQTIDKRIFNVEKSLSAEGSSAIEILEQIPSVDVDMDGVISLRGSSNVKILIDGKPSGLSNEDNSALLEQIPSSTIETVEIITNPSAKYDPDGMSGIINVVLKQNRLKGLTGSIGTGYADPDRYNLNGQINFRNKKINISSMLAYRTSIRNVGGTNHMVYLDDTGSVFNILDQLSDGFRDFDSYTGRLNTSYSLNQKNKIFAGLMLSYRTRNFEELITYRNGARSDSLQPIYQRLAQSENNSESTTYTFGWEKTFKREGQTLNVDFRQTDNQTDETGNHLQDDYFHAPDSFEVQITTRDDERSTRTFQLDYTHPLGEDQKLELGLKTIETHMDNYFSSISQTDSDTSWTDNIDLNTHFLFDEGIYAGYVTYSQKIGLLGFQGGVRVEQARTEADVFVDSIFVNEYQSIFPSAHLNYTLAPQKDIQMSYSRRVNRPRVRSVVPITNYYDPLNIRTGNPELLPEYIDSYELNYTQFRKGISFNAGVYYRQINDLMRRYKELKEINGNTVSVTTFRNFDTGHSYGAEAMINAKPWEPLKLMLSGNVTRTVIDESGLDADINTSSYGYYLRGTATYSPFPNTDIQMFTMYRSPREIAQGSMSDMLFANLSVKHKLWEKKGSISLQVSDLFNSRRFEYNLVTENFEQIRERTFSNRYIKLNFSYTFGKFVDTERQRGTGGRDDMDMDMGID